MFRLNRICKYPYYRHRKNLFIKIDLSVYANKLEAYFEDEPVEKHFKAILSHLKVIYIALLGCFRDPLYRILMYNFMT